MLQTATEGWLPNTKSDKTHHNVNHKTARVPAASYSLLTTLSQRSVLHRTPPFRCYLPPSSQAQQYVINIPTTTTTPTKYKVHSAQYTVQNYTTIQLHNCTTTHLLQPSSMPTMAGEVTPTDRAVAVCLLLDSELLLHRRACFNREANLQHAVAELHLGAVTIDVARETQSALR